MNETVGENVNRPICIIRKRGRKEGKGRKKEGREKGGVLSFLDNRIFLY